MLRRSLSHPRPKLIAPQRGVNNKKGLFGLLRSNRIAHPCDDGDWCPATPEIRTNVTCYLAEYSILFCLVSAIAMLPGVVVVRLAFRNAQWRDLHPLICTALGRRSGWHRSLCWRQSGN